MAASPLLPRSPDVPTAFTARNAQRVARATVVVERAYRLPPLPGGGRLGGTGGVALAKTGASGISAFDGTTVGSGDVTLYQVEEDDTVTATDVTLTARNIGGAVAGNTWVLVGFGDRGPWVLVEICPA
jgi:hypothetical protein